MRRLKTSCVPIVFELYPRFPLDYFDKEQQLPWLVGMVLHAASGTKFSPNFAGVRAAALTLDKFIQDGSGEVVSKMEEKRLMNKPIPDGK